MNIFATMEYDLTTHFDYEALTINCATQNDGSIIDYNDSIFFDFKKTDEI